VGAYCKGVCWGMNNIELQSDQYLNAKQVRERYGSVSNTWLFRRMRDASFPQPSSRLGGRTRFWLLSELLEWETNQIRVTENARHRPVTKPSSKTLN
jgi:predicted DNA-binding transcriptional regulator AlpA